ncbi:hypothetical protein T02_29 [Trichinella nativa]|uniref:Uncharacterized protein n=1 Tax=Trichinella nativa TaxID=6335 RepID=A0A0V1LAS0_9BILA|nr:hypothetical protein T02_29 [Trichinella nativa]
MVAGTVCLPNCSTIWNALQFISGSVFLESVLENPYEFVSMFLTLYSSYSSATRYNISPVLSSLLCQFSDMQSPKV